MFNYVPDDSSIIPNLGHIQSVSDFLGIAINTLIGVGISMSVVFIGLAGVRYITSGGNPDDLDRAKKALTYSVVALVITVGSIAIKVIFVDSILGVTDPNLTNPTPNF